MISNRRFKNKRVYEDRRKLAMSIYEQYDNCIPVIIEKSIYEHHLPELDKSQFIVPYNMTLANLMFIIRKRLECGSKTSVFLYAGDFPLTSLLMTLGEVMDLYGDRDGFLYLNYRGEDCFG